MPTGKKPVGKACVARKDPAPPRRAGPDVATAGEVVTPVTASAAVPAATARKCRRECTLLHAGAETGLLRSDVDPLDVGFALGGVLLITSDKGQRDRAGRMLDLLLDGLRYRPG